MTAAADAVTKVRRLAASWPAAVFEALGRVRRDRRTLEEDRQQSGVGADFFATIHAAVGVDYSKNLYDGDRPVPVTDGGKPITALFA